MLSLDADEAPLALVQQACAERALTIVETASTDAWGRIAARDAVGAQVSASWERASSPEGGSWIVILSGSAPELLNPFVAALHAARAAG